MSWWHLLCQAVAVSREVGSMPGTFSSMSFVCYRSAANTLEQGP